LYALASAKEQFGVAQTGQKNQAIKNPTPAKIAATRIASTIRSNAHDPGSISAPPRGRNASCICARDQPCTSERRHRWRGPFFSALCLLAPDKRFRRSNVIINRQRVLRKQHFLRYGKLNRQCL
jgi:hypothetical protein